MEAKEELLAGAPRPFCGCCCQAVDCRLYHMDPDKAPYAKKDQGREAFCVVYRCNKCLWNPSEPLEEDSPHPYASVTCSFVPLVFTDQAQVFSGTGKHYLRQMRREKGYQAFLDLPESDPNSPYIWSGEKHWWERNLQPA